jgi:type VI secretion system protein ImpA
VQKLKDIDHVLSERLSQRWVNEPKPAQDEEDKNGSDTVTPAQPAVLPTGEIVGRDDVIRTLDRLCEYYKRYEPSSPVPLLLMRAKRLVSMDFMEILQDLAPNGIAQAQAIGGAESEGSSE